MNACISIKIHHENKTNFMFVSNAMFVNFASYSICLTRSQQIAAYIDSIMYVVLYRIEYY